MAEDRSPVKKGHDAALCPQHVGEALCDFLRTEVLAEGVAFDAATPLSELGVDSLSIVEVLLFVERHFGVSVPESHLTRANLHSVDALAQCVCVLAEAGAGTGER